MAFAAARMILKDKRRKSKEDFAPVPVRNRSKVGRSTTHKDVVGFECACVFVCVYVCGFLFWFRMSVFKAIERIRLLKEFSG